MKSERSSEQNRKEVEEKILVGLKQAAEGKTVPGREAEARLRERAAKRRKGGN